MRTVVITYPDRMTGAAITREISDWRQDPEYPGCINAYCHLRAARRTFLFDLIGTVTDPQTGEIIDDTIDLFGMLPTDDQSIGYLARKLIPAVKLLKLYSRRTRGFARRERLKIVQFVVTMAGIDPGRGDDVDVWLKALLEFDADRQIGAFSRLPADIKASSRMTAIAIARGSGRKPIDPTMKALADELFPL